MTQTKSSFLTAFTRVFRIIDKHSGSSIKPVHQQNHVSAYQRRSQVEKELLDQIQIGHYIILIVDRKPAVVSAMAAIPKEDGSVRLIHDGSRPIGAAMNNYSQPDPVKFQTLQDACQLAKPFYYCAKIDLQAAYCPLPIHCNDYKATGLQWHFEGENKPTFLFDSRLLFGSNKGPSHFQFHWLSQAIRRCMLCKGFRGVVAYIDDFFIAAATYEEYRKWMDILIKLLRKLGFLISWKKVVGPSQCITFLGQGQTPATLAAAPALQCTQAHQQTATAEFSGLAKLGMPSDPRRKIFSLAHTGYPATSPAAAT